MRIQRSAEHRVVPWANGLGVTADVFLSPPGTDDWTWRLSIADISDDLPFSVMSGIDRHIVLAQGRGMALTVDGAPEHRMERTTPTLSFAGEALTTCRLLDGPVAALNLMVRRGRATGSLHVVAVPPTMPIRWWPGDTAMVVLDGSITVDSTDRADLATFDAVLLPANAEPAATISAGPAGAWVAIASVNERQPICGTALLAMERLRNHTAPPPDASDASDAPQPLQPLQPLQPPPQPPFV